MILTGAGLYIKSCIIALLHYVSPLPLFFYGAASAILSPLHFRILKSQFLIL